MGTTSLKSSQNQVMAERRVKIEIIEILVPRFDSKPSLDGGELDPERDPS